MHHREREISPRRHGGRTQSLARSARWRQSAWTLSLRSTCSNRAPRTERSGENSRRRGGMSSAGACICICARRRTTRPRIGRQPDEWLSTRARAPRFGCRSQAGGDPSRSHPLRRARSACPGRRRRDRRRRAAPRSARGSRRCLPPLASLKRKHARRRREQPSKLAGHIRCRLARRRLRRSRNQRRVSHHERSGASSSCSRGASGRTACGTRCSASAVGLTLMSFSTDPSRTCRGPPCSPSSWRAWRRARGTGFSWLRPARRFAPRWSPGSGRSPKSKGSSPCQRAGPPTSPSTTRS